MKTDIVGVQEIELVGGPQDGAKVHAVGGRLPQVIHVGPRWLGDGYAAWSRSYCWRFPCSYYLDGWLYRFLPVLLILLGLAGQAGAQCKFHVSRASVQAPQFEIRQGRVAQLAEHRADNPKAEGSIPSPTNRQLVLLPSPERATGERVVSTGGIPLAGTVRTSQISRQSQVFRSPQVASRSSGGCAS